MKYEDIDKIKDKTGNNEVDSFYLMKKKNVVAESERPYAEIKPENMNIDILQNNLGNCLRIIDDEVMKGYVTRLSQFPIIVQEKEVYDNLNAMHFFKISELVYQEDEFSVDKLAMVFHALASKPCTLVLMLRSDGAGTDFYLGARPNDNHSAGTMFQMLKQSLLGFFPGSKISDYYDEDMKKDMQSINIGCISSVTSVADYKQEQDMITNKEFIQGLEKFVYAMHGKAYTAVFIADNLSYEELMFKKREYEQIYTQISPFANMQMNFTVSDSKSEANGTSDGKTSNLSYTSTKGSSFSITDTDTHTSGTSETTGDTLSTTHTDNESVSDGNTHTKGTSDGVSKTVTNGVNVGGRLGIFMAGGSHSVSKGTSHTDSVSDSISKTLTHGFSDSKAISKSRTMGENESDSTAKSRGTSTNESAAYTSGEAFNLVNSQTLTDTFGNSKGITLNAENMTLNLVLQRLKKHLERIEECESFGMWNFAAYFLGETAAETETAANTYKSVVAGTDSGIECNAKLLMKSISMDCKTNYSNVLSDAAKKHQIIIRDDIIAFLRLNSGGYPISDIVEFDGEEYEIRVFLSLDSSDEYYYIEKPLEYFLEKTKGKIIPIGIDSGDNYYCVNNETGKVYYWNSGDDKYYCLANSLEGFVEHFNV